MRARQIGMVFALLIPALAFGFSRTPLPDGMERQSVYPAGTHVLVIGMSEYRDRSWPKLNGRRDAERIQRLFLERGVPASAITLVEPEVGRGPALEKAVVEFGASLPAGAGAGLRVIVYIAGHGYTDEGLGYLVPPDAPDPQRQPTAFHLAALPISTLIARVAEYRAAHVLLIVDACFSGLALDSLPRDRFPRPGPGTNTDGRVLQVITAGTAGQTVADDGQFAELVAAGLMGAADLNLDGWISGTELGMYLRLRMAENSERRQTPAFGNVLGLNNRFSAGENWFASAQLPLKSVAHNVPADERGTASFSDCEDCPPLRVVPAPDLAAAVPTPNAALTPYLAMSTHEVTFDEFDACFRSAGCTHWPWSASGMRGRLPVTDVNRADATQYTTWLGCITGEPYRLPTDAEWLTAARTDVARLAQWNLHPTGAVADCRGCGSAWDAKEAAPVGSFAPNDLGLYDMLGNVWEWVADCRATPSANPCGEGVVRGGGFTTRRSVAILLPRAREPAATRDRNIGFRVVRELEGASQVTAVSCAAAPAAR